jgi:glutathione S-transferase
VESRRPRLFADRGCPFSHRVLALFAHLGVAHDLTEAAPGETPEGLLRLSPSGRVPMLVHGDLVIGESRVMLEHVAEVYGFDDAWPRDLAPRTRVREAMAMMDAYVAPQLFRDDLAEDDRRLAEYVRVFEALAAEPPVPSLVTFHFAPIWMRFKWWHPNGGVTRAIAGRPLLATWLDRAAGIDAIARTAADEAETTAAFRQHFARAIR